MRSKILDKYLGKSIFKKDYRKEELVNDKIDLEKWQYNMLYATNVPGFDALSLDDGDEKIIEKASDVFIDVIENLRGTIQVFYPDYLKNESSLWYIAAYPDVVDYFYPGLRKYRKAKPNQVETVMNLQKKRTEEIERFEVVGFPQIKSGILPDAEKYFIALKDYYKKKHALLQVLK